MAGFEDVATPAPQASGWDAVATPYTSPNFPDVSGVQKMAQDNLAAANDNKVDGKPPPTPLEYVSTAAGFPVDKVINGSAQPSDINAANRVQYTKAIDNGSAINSSDWLPTMLLHGIAPIASGLIQNAQHPLDTMEDIAKTAGSEAAKGAVYMATSTPGSLASDVMQSIVAPLVATATKLAGAAYEGMGGEFSLPWAKFLTNPIPEFAQSPLAPVRSLLQPDYKPQTFMGEATQQAANVVPYLAGGEVSAARKITGIAMAGLGGALGEQGQNTEKGKQIGRLIGSLPGFIYGASNPIGESVAAKLGKDPAAVTLQDVSQAVAEGSKDLHPPASDFKTAATATGVPEKGFKTVYNDGGVTPEKIITDAQQDPTILSDVAAGKVPEAYEHLVEDRQFPTEQAEKLHVVRDEETRSFSVVDRDGDHVQGGFDSYEEAQHHIEDKQFEAEERAAIENEPEAKPITEKTPAGEQTVIPGAEKISDKELAERKMEEPLRETVAQKSANEGLFDVAGRGQGDLLDTIDKTPKPPKPTYIPPSTIGKPTSLASFIRNNGGIKDIGGDLKAMGADSLIKTKGKTFDEMTEMAHQAGYFKERPSINDLKDALDKSEHGKNHFRDADTDRVLKAQEAAKQRELQDPARIEHEADLAGIDTAKVDGENDKARSKRLLDELGRFYSNEQGSGPTYRKILGNIIVAAEKFAGKLGGGFFEKVAEGYIKTFQPELAGDKALRADAFLAKYKASLQDAENSYFRQFAKDMRRWDKASKDEALEYIDDQETGRWNEDDDAEHATHQALLDRTFEEEKKAIGADSEKGYKENYFPLQFKDPVKVKEFFDSPAMIRKYGADWFTKPRTFNMTQDAIRAGFELRSYNPARIVVSRLLAGDNMIRTMDLLNDMKESGVATRSTAFGLDKRIAKTQQAIKDLQEKYKSEFEKKNNPAQTTTEGLPPAESKKMQLIEKRMDNLKARLDAFTKEKADLNLTPAQLKELKLGLRIIGPDSKAWNIHPQAAPLWKNAMEMKGLYEHQGITGDVYRAFTGAKNTWTSMKLSISLFHPFHEVGINLAGAIAAPLDHLIQGGKFSDLALKDVKDALPIGDSRAAKAWNTPEEARTPQQHADIQRMKEGGFVPTMSARDHIRFRENFDKAIAGVGLNNLKLIATALQLPGKILEPLYSKWIPNLRSQMYFSLTDKALLRDPTLAQDAGKRAEAFREISKNVDRTYGQLNQDTLFWNKTVKDAFNASYISGGWKLAQIYNARGLLQPLNIAYKFAKTGEFSKADVTYNMLHAYAYTGVTLMMGAAINKMLGNPIGKTAQEAKDIKDYVWSVVEDCLFPKTGEKNPDGTPIRLNQPAFTKEYFMLARDINEHGLIAGAGEFMYQGTLLPGIGRTLSAVGDGVSDALMMKKGPIGKDFLGRTLISDPTDLHQWMNAGWDSVNPITLSTYERAESKGSKTGKLAGLAGFPIAGAYINQTPFEQKIIAKYDEQNPPDGTAYEGKLKDEMKGAVANKDTKEQTAIAKRMKEEGMSDEQISHSKKPFTTPLAEFAWKKLSPQDQKELIDSASEEEKKKFKVKTP